MNYQRIYDQIIDRARKEQRTKQQELYYESHHIVARCMGGLNKKENLILLTAREHFVVHWLLARAYPSSKGLAKAFDAMCTLKKSYQQRYTPSSRAISEAKELSNRARRVTCLNANTIEKRTATRMQRGNYKRTEESVQKGIQTRRERNSYVGRSFSQEHREKLSIKKRRAILRFDLTGQLVETHTSLSSAANTLGISISGISRALTGKVPNYKGFIWKYD
jgi:hypothetical protein